MAQTAEGKVKKKVKEMLEIFGVYYFMPVQTGYGKAGLDFHCIHYGIGFCIETKAPGETLTPRQELTRSDVQAARGKVFVVGEHWHADTGEFSGMEDLRDWLHRIKTALGPHAESCSCVNCT